MNAPWEEYVSARFPAYLFPAAQRSAVSVEEAQHFLRSFAGDQADLELVTYASLFADDAKRKVLESLAHRTGPELARNLPSVAVVESRTWDGAYRGRLDVAGTLAFHAAGQPTRFVTRDRTRSYELPQNVLVRATLERLHDALRSVREAGLSKREHWGTLLLDAEPAVRNLLTRTLLHQVSVPEIGARHVHAASNARHPAYRDALQWHRWLEEANGSSELRAIHLARGALLPLSPDARFEIAVLVRLVEAFRTELPGSEWTYECSAIISGRHEVACFEHRSGAVIEVIYNQSVFETRARDQLLQRYLGELGRMRPDITVVVAAPGRPKRAVVIEVKRTTDDGYIRRGLEEALFYRYELEGHLIDVPKSIMICEKTLPAVARADDEIIGLGWDIWPPPFLIEAIKEAALAQF